MKTIYRPDVYAAIDSERAYQNRLQGNSKREHVDAYSDLGSLLTFLDVYVRKAQLCYSAPSPANREATLHEIRKVAAIAVRAMEYHGAPHREAVVQDGEHRHPFPKESPPTFAECVSQQQHHAALAGWPHDKGAPETECDAAPAPAGPGYSHARTVNLLRGIVENEALDPHARVHAADVLLAHSA